MDYEQKINLYFDAFDDQFKTTVPNIIAETATEFFKSKFTTQEWEGVPWQALSPAYAKRKTKGKGRILTKIGALMNSITPSEVSAARVVISAGNSKVTYAQAHNEGLHITGVRKVKPYVNSNFMGKGKAMAIPAHTRQVNYTMPKRQFMGVSTTGNKLIRARLIAAWNAKK